MFDARTACVVAGCVAGRVAGAGAPPETCNKTERIGNENPLPTAAVGRVVVPEHVERGVQDGEHAVILAIACQRGVTGTVPVSLR